MRMVVMVAAIFISGLLALAGVSAFSESVRDVRANVTGHCVADKGKYFNNLAKYGNNVATVIATAQPQNDSVISYRWTEGDLYISDPDVLGSSDGRSADSYACSSGLLRSNEKMTISYLSEGAAGSAITDATVVAYKGDSGGAFKGDFVDSDTMRTVFSAPFSAGYDFRELGYAPVRFVPVPGTSGFLGSFISSGLDLVVPGMIFVLVIILLVGVYQFASKKSMR